MATVTNNIKLTLPGYADAAEIGVLNDNFVKIDGEITKLYSRIDTDDKAIADLDKSMKEANAAIETLTASVKEINATLVSLDGRLKKLEPQATASQDAQGVNV